MSPPPLSQPVVSVIMRIHRPADRALAAVQSLLRQTLEAWELALVGFGAEEVFDGIGRDPRIRHDLVFSTTDSRAASLNRPVASTRGPFIAFVDSRDLASADRLALQCTFLQRGAEYGLVAAGVEYLRRRGRPGHRVVLQVTPDGLMALLLHQNVIPFGSVMLRRECFDRLGGFDEHLQHGVEHDLWVRIALHCRSAVLSKVLCLQVMRDRGSWRARGDLDSCPNDRRRRYVEQLLQTHPRGARILEDSVSRYPDDDVLWDCYVTGPGASSRSLVDPADRQEPAWSAALTRGGIDRQLFGGFGRAVGSTDSAAGCNLSALFMACLRYRLGDPAPFNRLGRHYLHGNPLLAYLCHLRALSIEPHQGPVLSQALAAWSDGVTIPRVSAAQDPCARSAGQLARGRSPIATCKVSVLMPTYNGAQRIQESIQSVLNQTFQDFELVIVDDGSEDRTEEVVRSLGAPRVRYIRTEHRGLAAALNTAQQHAGGRYLAYLDDDDVYYPEHLARLVPVLDTSDAAMVYSKSRLVYGQRDRGTFRPKLDLGTYTDDYDYDSLHHRCIISTLNVVHRRECMTPLGGFDERLPRCMDWDFWVRLSEQFPIVHRDAFTGEYRHHEGNMSARDFPERRVLTDLLQNYFTSCRGLAILCWAAHLQGRLEECQQLRRALERSPFAFREDVYRRLLHIVPRMPRGSRLAERLFSHRPRWYLRYLVSLWRERRWSAFQDIPPTLYPRLLCSGASSGWSFVVRRWYAR
jgi:glycosyltransferase involved in cell wall biosynthesis